ncbi:MAG TPA: hypothetical protein GX702_10530 [Chloroflexi bacterium]|jgi:hypothetical protein|nr:hypothetical protein [Chloroflexota bacterium]
MSPLLQIIIWFVIGAGCGCAHLLWLRRSLNRVDAEKPRTIRRFALGMPLRLLAVAPFLILAARQGLPASVGFILGSVIGRWALYLGTGMYRIPATWPNEQG